MAQFEQFTYVDLSAGIRKVPVNGGIFSHDIKSHKLGVIVTNHGQPVTLTGQIMGIAKLATGEKLEFSGSIDSQDASRAYVELPESAYITGPLTVAIRNIDTNSNKIVLIAYTGYVDGATDGTPVVPPGTLPDDIEDFLAELDNMREIVADAEEAVENIDDIVLVQENQPTSETNKIWIQPQSDEYKVPTWEEYSDLKSAFGEVVEYHAPTNLYNKNSALNRTNYMVQASGDYVSLTGAQASHPIKVELGKTYTFKYSAGWFGTSNNRIVRFCDAEGNLDTGSGRFWNATDNDSASGTFTVTEDVGYVCVNVRASDAGVMVFNEGSSLASYSDWFEPYYNIKASALPGDMPLPDNAQTNLLYGKKLAVTGDSICYGAGSSGGYAAIIGTNNNMTVSNIAVSGGTICSGTVYSGGGARFCISASVDNMPENYDYYIVEGGANDADASTGATLGTISSGYTATLDTTTMCGAMESLCKKLQTNFPGKKYGFIFPHNVYGDTSVWNTGWRTEMKKCLNKWGIPYLDLSDECAQLRNIDALRVYTSSSDGWHPTEDGYKLYYVPKIEAWLKTL